MYRKETLISLSLFFSLTQFEGTRSAHTMLIIFGVYTYNVAHEDNCYSKATRVSCISKKSLVTLTVSLLRSAQQFLSRLPSEELRSLYKKIIFIVGVGGGSHVLRRERRRRDTLREWLHPRQLYLRAIRAAG